VRRRRPTWRDRNRHDEGIERLFAGVAPRAVTAVVTQGNRVGEGHVQTNRARDPVATWATSSACVSRVRMWSSGNTKTWVLPASRRKALRMQDTVAVPRSKHVRNSSGFSSFTRCPAPSPRVAPTRGFVSSCASRWCSRPDDVSAVRARDGQWPRPSSRGHGHVARGTLKNPPSWRPSADCAPRAHHYSRS